MIALLVGIASSAQRSFAESRVELGALFLERMCTRLEQRAEAAWTALSDQTIADLTQPPDVEAA